MLLKNKHSSSNELNREINLLYCSVKKTRSESVSFQKDGTSKNISILITKGIDDHTRN